MIEHYSTCKWSIMTKAFAYYYNHILDLFSVELGPYIRSNENETHISLYTKIHVLFLLRGRSSIPFRNANFEWQEF